MANNATFFFVLISSVMFGFVLVQRTKPNQGYHAGLCHLYKGSHCKNILNASASRFINVSLGFNETERLAVEIGKQIHIIFKTASTERVNACKSLIEKVGCHFIFPLCSVDEQRLDWCREDCEYLFSSNVCGDELHTLVGAGKSILYGKLSGIVYRFDSCKDFKSINDDPGSNNSCRHLPFLNLPAMVTSDPTPDKLLIIVSSVVVSLLLLCLLFIFYHRMMYRKSRAHSVHYENGKDGVVKRDRLSNVVSMRDRIREWKVAPSELIELVDICKSRGVLEIPVDNIEYLKDLGSGQYGLVFQGKVVGGIEGEASNVVAVKTLREGSSQEAIKEFCQEVNIMSTFSHPNVVKLIGVSLAGEPYCMIFEFVEFGDLASFLRNCADVDENSKSMYPKLTVTDQLAMALQIASGMKYISSIRCVHRDLAARNCLVGRGLVVKISDFGLSRDVYTSEYYRMDKTRMLPVRWLPPEAFTDGKFTIFSDVYSYGVLLWEIFTFAKLPYEECDNTKTMEVILEGQILSKPDSCPGPVYDIMKQCWTANPEKRILFPDIINELCSLDDYGQRFNADGDQIVDIYRDRMTPSDSQDVSFRKNSCSLSYSNNSFNMDEPPINVERLPAKPTTAEQNTKNYSINGHVLVQTANKLNYDGVVPLTENSKLQQQSSTIEGPRAIHSRTPPEDLDIPSKSYGIPGGSYNDGAPLENFHSSPKSKLINGDIEGPQETYDVPPGINNHCEDSEETYSVPPVPKHGRQRNNEGTQETYDVPPTSHIPQLPHQATNGYDDENQETYDVPPVSLNFPHGYQEEPQETYDVPPALIQIHSTQQNATDGDDKESQETYDIPPKLEENLSDELYQNSPNLRNGHYSVPQSPFLQRRKQENDNHILNTNKLKSPLRGGKQPYENVGFDGKPLLS